LQDRIVAKEPVWFDFGLRGGTQTDYGGDEAENSLGTVAPVIGCVPHFQCDAISSFSF
jgi:hypothetical protein